MSADLIKPTKEQIERAGLLLCQTRNADPAAPAFVGDETITFLDWHKSEAYPVLILMLNRDRILDEDPRNRGLDRG